MSEDLHHPEAHEDHHHSGEGVSKDHLHSGKGVSETVGE